MLKLVTLALIDGTLPLPQPFSSLFSILANKNATHMHARNNVIVYNYSIYITYRTVPVPHRTAPAQALFAKKALA